QRRNPRLAVPCQMLEPKILVMTCAAHHVCNRFTMSNHFSSVHRVFDVSLTLCFLAIREVHLSLHEDQCHKRRLSSNWPTVQILRTLYW
ncbi:hypothetical protein JI435_306590, partial [Parastagonospora nodorum SN15]